MPKLMEIGFDVSVIRDRYDFDFPGGSCVAV